MIVNPLANKEALSDLIKHHNKPSPPPPRHVSLYESFPELILQVHHGISSVLCLDGKQCY